MDMVSALPGSCNSLLSFLPCPPSHMLHPYWRMYWFGSSWRVTVI
jgi:hypothetical protein